MKCSFLLFILLIFNNCLFLNSYDSNDKASSDNITTVDGLVIKRFPITYNIKYTVYADKNTLSFSEPGRYVMVYAIPLPSSNQYQEMTNTIISDGEILQIPGTDERYVRVESDKPIESVTVEYELKVYDYYFDLNRIQEIYPYNKQSTLYIDNTKFVNHRIDPEHPLIINMADEIIADSIDDLDYIKKAYTAIQNQLDYKSSGTFSTLDQIFTNGGGDCGALSSVYISLLRHKGIPARYVTGGTLSSVKGFVSHYWVEFYLERYGWIPSDPSFTSSSNTFYLGYVDSNRVAFNRGMSFKHHNGKEEITLSNLQYYSYSHWLWGGKISGEYSINRKVELTSLHTPDYKNEYNKLFEEKDRKAIIDLINSERTAREMNILNESELLNDAASLLLNSKFTGENHTLDYCLSSVGYSAKRYMVRYYYFTGNTLYPENVFFNSQGEYVVK